MTKEIRKLFEDMPDRFTRQDFINKAKRLGKSFTYYGYLINEAINMGIIKRLDRGKFVKVKNAT
jgi:hypothetical protein